MSEPVVKNSLPPITLRSGHTLDVKQLDSTKRKGTAPNPGNNIPKGNQLDRTNLSQASVQLVSKTVGFVEDNLSLIKDGVLPIIPPRNRSGLSSTHLNNTEENLETNRNRPRVVEHLFSNLDISRIGTPEGQNIREENSGVHVISDGESSETVDPEIILDNREYNIDLEDNISCNSNQSDNWDREFRDLEDLDEMADFNYRDFDRRIPLYSGERENLRHFIRLCDIVYGSLNCAGRENFFINMAFKLTGKITEILERREVMDWETLRAALLNIDVSLPLSFHYKRLEDLRQKNRQSVKEFAEEIKTVLREMTEVIFRIYDNEASRRDFQREAESRASRVFREGLFSPLKERVFALGVNRTLEQIVQIALEEEPYVKEYARNSDGHRPSIYNANNTNDRNNMTRLTVGDTRVKRERDYGNANQNNNYNKYQRPLTCYGCGQTGHIRTDCPGNRNIPIKREYQNRTNNPVQNGRMESRGQMSCTHCGRSGHVVDTCYARLNAQQRDQNRKNINAFRRNESLTEKGETQLTRQEGSKNYLTDSGRASAHPLSV